jgi:hypothetical protein
VGIAVIVSVITRTRAGPISPAASAAAVLGNTGARISLVTARRTASWLAWATRAPASVGERFNMPARSCLVAEPGGGRDGAGFQFRDGIKHHRIHHPRHRFDIPDLIRQPDVVAGDDSVTPLVEAGDHRLPRIQQRLYHGTIVAPTPDNLGGSRCRQENSNDAIIGRNSTTAPTCQGFSARRCPLCIGAVLSRVRARRSTGATHQRKINRGATPIT